MEFVDRFTPSPDRMARPQRNRANHSAFQDRAMELFPSVKLHYSLRPLGRGAAQNKKIGALAPCILYE